MRRVPQKAIFCVLVVLTLNVCVMEPMGFSAFLDDPKVIEIIEKGLERVKIKNDSDDFPSLTAGNGQITGLDPKKYYVVEEWNESGVFLNARFVSKDGTRNEKLIEIGRVSGGAIIGLTNSNSYRVRFAKSLTNQVNYADLAAAPSTLTGTSITPANGIIKLPSPTNSYYMEIPTVSLDTVKIVPPPASPNVLVSGIIKLEAVGTTTDYVFADESGITSATSEILNLDNIFKILQVDISHPSSIGTYNVTFSLVDIGGGNLGLQTGSGSFTESITFEELYDDGEKINFTVTTAGTSYQWLYNGDPVSPANTSNAFVFGYNAGNAFTESYLRIGTHTITLILVSGGKTYSANFEITVSYAP